MSESEANVEMYLWKKEMYIVYDAKKNDQVYLCQAYRVTIRQCTEALRAKLEAEYIYEDITSPGEVIESLKLI